MRVILQLHAAGEMQEQVACSCSSMDFFLARLAFRLTRGAQGTEW